MHLWNGGVGMSRSETKRSRITIDTLVLPVRDVSAIAFPRTSNCLWQCLIIQRRRGDIYYTSFLFYEKEAAERFGKNIRKSIALRFNKETSVPLKFPATIYGMAATLGTPKSVYAMPDDFFKKIFGKENR